MENSRGRQKRQVKGRWTVKLFLFLVPPMQNFPREEMGHSGGIGVFHGCRNRHKETGTGFGIMTVTVSRKEPKGQSQLHGSTMNLIHTS